MWNQIYDKMLGEVKQRVSDGETVEVLVEELVQEMNERQQLVFFLNDTFSLWAGATVYSTSHSLATLRAEQRRAPGTVLRAPDGAVIE
jgi:hypothetical protein